MKHRVLLACLLIAPNTVVPVRRLIDRIWGDAPPDDARAVVHTYVSRVRAVLGCPELIETLPEGYRIHVREQLRTTRAASGWRSSLAVPRRR
ncbi:helix-turn-helix domain-containing protein [Allokutzneria sp. A3M-2-11 16]|uniref:AfsR/SARP family transcriptional regulator n=1 Tax=Allokutzneria sp. A3M-2-11 16 TaxID=2962043 RepID=UPI0020B6C8CF|nr:helix-turn-helix domain-containing protein [Allokutzneria sp. A3M-2-11 16]MCP3801776.1 helix-turn-helix domain-containing protein [Allokutzneria sp. A3M-2-11 16]